MPFCLPLGLLCRTPCCNSSRGSSISASWPCRCASTFNEVDMKNLMKLCYDFKDASVEKHGVRLGLMLRFIKAAVSGLQNQPTINEVIDGDDIIYRDYIDISVAVCTPKGLVVPVIRNADKMNCGEIEKEINSLANKANEDVFQLMIWLEVHLQYPMVDFMEAL